MCASMASNIYHPLPAFYFILVAVIWCSASVTRRFADRSYFAFRTSVLAFSLTDCVWGSVICGQIAVPLAVRHLLCDIFFFTLVLSVATLGHYLARSCRPDNRRSSPQHWKPRAKQSRTVALLTALCAAALFSSCTVHHKKIPKPNGLGMWWSIVSSSRTLPIND